MEDCIFCKIAGHVIPKEFTYEDEEIMAFPDIRPLKPVHILIIPKQHIEDFLDVDSPELIGKLGKVVQRVVREKGLMNKGYRVVVNGGGAQEVPHLHIHLMGPYPKAAAMS